MGKRRIEEDSGKERIAKKSTSNGEAVVKEKFTPKVPKMQATKTATFDSTDGEADFPRGGASALTPAEVRDARSQAEAEFQSEVAKSHKKGKQRKRQSADVATEDPDGESLFGFTGKAPKSVEILRHKTLCVGMRIWGAVAEVNHRDLAISLPGGLRGFVQADEASDVAAEVLTGGKAKKAKLKKKRRTKGAEAESKLSDEDMSDKESDEFSLKDLFSVGQLVACTVLSLENMKAKTGKGKSIKRIGLSLRLSNLLEGLTVDSIHEGSPITACVSSIEDHGYLLTLGVTGVSGFLLHQNCDSDSKLKKGQLVHGVALAVDKKRGTVNLKAGEKVTAGAMVQDHEGVSVEQLLPGALVNARVRAVLRDGLLLSFLTYFSGTVDLFHLDVPLLGSKWAENYTVNQRLRARILYVNPITKAVGLTLNSDLLHNSAPSWAVNVGEVYNNALVRRVDPTIGLLIELPSKPKATAGYVHISNASDEHIEKLEKKFTEGKKVKARVIGFRIMDGLAIASLKATVLEQMLLSHTDVKPGMMVHGTVTAVESFGAIVQLGEGLKGLCPLQHMSEYQRSTPSAKFQAGAKLKFRVVSVDPQSKKITLTHKKSLVSSKLTPITSFEDAVEGLVTHGWITGIEDYGCFVSFYNDVKGLVHRSEMGLFPGTDAATAFQLGQVVKCRVLRADPSAKRLSISFATTTRSEDENAGEQIKSGSIISGSVVEVKENSLLIDVVLKRSIVKGVLAYSQLSDNLGHIEHMKTLIKPGFKFDQLLVLEKNDRKVTLSAKFSLLQAASSLPSDVSQLQASAVHQGFIASITTSGCFVRFLGRLTGLATLSEIADVFVADASQFFTAGQSVRAKILEVKEEKGKFYVSLKQSLCFSTDASLIQGYFIEEEKILEMQSKSTGSSNVEWLSDLTIGSYVDGEIQDVKDYGVILNLYKHNDIVGFLTHYQLGEPVEVGSKVRARVLDVVKVDGIVDLTVRKELFSSQESTSASPKKTSSKKRKSSETLGVAVQQKVTAVVELVKDEYLVLSLPDHDNLIAFASTRDYNLRVVDPHKLYQPGQRLTAKVQKLPSANTGGRLLLLLNKVGKDVELASPKKARRPVKHDIGVIVEGEILSIDTVTITVGVGKGIKGSLHISEVRDEFQEGHPFADYKVGQNITAKVLAKVKGPKTNAETGDFHLELTVRPSELAVDGEQVAGKTGNRPLFETVEVGQMVTAYVQEVDDEKAWLLVGPHLRGRLFVLDSSVEPAELRQFKQRFTVGQPLRCWVLHKDLAKGTLDLSLREVKPATEPNTKEPRVELEEGTIFAGKVTKVNPGVGGAIVQIGPKMFGKVHVTHMSDIWVDEPAKQFEVGQFVKCAVLNVSTAADGKLRVDLSLRASLGGCGGEKTAVALENKVEPAAIVETLQDLSVGLLTQAYVKTSSKMGCFVTLSRAVEGRILVKNLSDSFVADIAESFPPGKVVRGRIVSLEPLSGRVEMSLKTNISKAKNGLEGEIKNEKLFEDLHLGDTISCQVRQIVSFGLFLRIDSSKIVGLCHVSEVADGFLKNLEEHFKVGQKVQAKILKLDSEKKRVSFGLKDSYFVDEKEADGGDGWGPESGSHDEEDSEVEEGTLNGPMAGKDDKDEHMDEIQGGENDDIEVLAANTSKESLLEESKAIPALEVDLDIDNNDSDEPGDHQNDDSRMEEDGDESKQKKREKKRLKKEREAAITAAEEKRLRDNEAPETVDEFEQLVRASPNSSFVWIKYMAFMLSIADVDKARAVADRALQTINFREEAEKMNVWVAYLNLENAYGNPKKEAVLQVFQKAVQYCDPKKLYIALLGIYERTEQQDMADELLKTMVRKFKGSAKVWLRYIQNSLKKGGAKKALDQSLLSLPKRKHLKVITQVSIMEFKLGSPERGRAIFEGIVRNYPRRLDLWSVYLDQEIRLGDVNVIRALFERAVSLELQPKKMKSLFKRYLDFEKANGDETRIEYVKTKAMEYVEAKLG